MMRRGLMSFLVLVLGLAIISVPKAAHANGFGRSNFYGYFDNNYDACGTQVFPGGISSGDAANFENTVIGHLSDGGNYTTGAEFIILTMEGYPAGTPRSTAHDGNVINQWKSDVDYYASQGWITWNINVSYSVNTFDQAGAPGFCSRFDGGNHQDVASEPSSGSAPAIVFSNPDGSYYIIKRNCGNPLGTFSALQHQPQATVQGYHVYDNGTPLAQNGALAAIDSQGLPTGANPFYFLGVPPGTRTVSGAVWQAANTTLLGYTWCYSTDANCENNVLGNPARMTRASSFNVNVGNGTVVDVRFWYHLNQDSATCTITGMPTSLSPGQKFTVTATVRNTGNLNWAASDTYNLGSSNPHDNTTWAPLSPGVNGNTSNRAFHIGTTASGGTYTSTFTATAPTTLGNYNFDWAVVHDGVAWISADCGGSTKVVFTAKHRIYGANLINIVNQFVRDNFTFPFNISTYFWPDAGIRPNGANAPRLWLAGIYGKDSNDNAATDNSFNADPNVMTTINTKAEFACPNGTIPGNNSCLQRVPMAYVPQDDGSGAANTATKDGSQTPNGNNWLSIKNRGFGLWNTYFGGIASTQNNNVGGQTGTHINNVEVSNLHIEALGITDCVNNDPSKCQSAQGGIANSGANGVQPDPADQANAAVVAPNAGLPNGSQGPTVGGQGTPGKASTWDNVRNPNKASAGFADNITQPNIEFTSNPSCGGTTLPQFNCDPNSMTSIFSGYARIFAAGNATSLLQDGQDGAHAPSQQYPNSSEPLTLTDSVDKTTNTRLRWDEYADWSQVDDKGHFTTTRASIPTGAYEGGHQVANYEVQYVDTGYPVCTGYSTADPDGIPNNGDEYTYCSSTTTCSNIGYRYDSIYATAVYWYDGSNQSEFGWIRTGSATTGSLPYGANGQTSPSRFAPNPNTTPGWAQVDNYWQPSTADVTTNLGSYYDGSNAASTNKPSHGSPGYWQLDFNGYPYGDPAYTNRFIYNSYNSNFFYYAYSPNTYSACVYPNGQGIYYTYNQNIDYYPSYGELYENSNSPYVNSPTTSYVFGRCNSNCPNGSATFDGSTDGTVDTGWSWVSNIRRVRYEQSFMGQHYRNLGPKLRSGSDSGDDGLLGLEGAPNLINFGRGMSWISNPVIGVSNADVFGAAGITSYFSSSNRSSAFLFSNGTIHGFTPGTNYQNYCINPDTQKVNTFFPTTQSGACGPADASNDAVSQIFNQNLPQMLASPTQTFAGGTTLSGGFNLNGGVYHVTGNLTLNNVTFCTNGDTSGSKADVGGFGGGTFIVDGSLYINGTTSYCNYTGSDPHKLPSVGFIVMAKNSGGTIDPYNQGIFVSPGVTSAVGSYFSNGVFSTGSVLLNPNGTPNNNRSASDQPFTLNGLAISRIFGLQRQFANNTGATQTETFQYDGRVVVAPPPGFAELPSAPAVWNEAVPFN